MDQEGEITTSIDSGVATITFAHPKRNSLPGTLLRRLAETVTSVANDRESRVLVLCSKGDRAFCAGASFDELLTINDENSGKEFFMGFARLILAMIRAPKFILTRVQGRAVGGGVGVVAASDYSIATTDASVKLSELAIGIGPFVVGPVIERKIGTGAFGTMAIDTDWHPAAWAEAHGLFSRVVSSIDDLDDEVQAHAYTLARANPEAVASLKRCMWQGTEHWETLLEERAAISGRLVLSDTTRAVLAGFRNG